MKTRSRFAKNFIGAFALLMLVSFSIPAVAVSPAGDQDNSQTTVTYPDGDKTPSMKCGGEKKEEKSTSATMSQGAESTKAGKCGEGKANESKCGESKSTSKEAKSKKAEASSVSSEQKAKTSEGKCGEGKCGEGKCGTDRY